MSASSDLGLKPRWTVARGTGQNLTASDREARPAGPEGRHSRELSTGARGNAKAGTGTFHPGVLMPSRIQSLRRRAFEHQHGLCCYCQAPMWLNSPTELPLGSPGKRAARRLLCTAEHLTARADGGSNSAINIAAACLHCNRTRHRRKHPPDMVRYRQEVAVRMARHGWHPAWVHRMCPGGAPGASCRPALRRQ